ncbi:hypothetical protein F5Y19DRAFT_474055 [Xylariaceae sp. FL1651]|nr:hypothetical protein F5Y19DRAFT_474055 [Xylariaceae sp. FL1651]
MGEQTILYVPPELREVIRTMRQDAHWHVINDYKTVWDFPNKSYQRGNFANRQPNLFRQFDRFTEADGELRPVERYNRPHPSAVCNAKAFIIYDTVLCNPFGCDRWTAGLDEREFYRAIDFSRDTGVVMGEYSHADGCPDIDDECWHNPRRTWRSRQFITQIYVGNSLGMLIYSTCFMQTVDDLDAEDLYSGREEFVVTFVALRYPNTVISIPYFRLPKKLDYPS